MTKCPFCKGELSKKTVTHPQVYRGKVYILENIPAEVCSQCGEVLLRPGVLEKIQQLIWSHTQPKRTAEVPVYDLAEIN
ncbi:MAG: type II toxin-antitoxin system MqsA family antitoxin [Chloroflexi bacterium]|nr:type II toxin-antitoxin system MqsA family antitoxin [Chloroflexota bacterium]